MNTKIYFALVVFAAMLFSTPAFATDCQNYTDITGHGNNHLLMNISNSTSISWCDATANKFCIDDLFCYNNTLKVATDMDESITGNNGTDYGSMCGQKLGWYHFKDFGAVNVDDKCGLTYGAITGANIGYVNSFVGTGLKLPGINTEYVSFTNFGGEHNSFSVSFWVKPNIIYDGSTSGFGSRLFRWQDAGTDWFFCGTSEGSCSTNGGFFAGLNSTTLISSTKSFSPNNWYFFAITYSFSTAGNFSKLYINGTLENTQIVYHAYDMDNLRFGSRGSPWSAYNGSIDELIFWNYTLSDTEITNLYNYSFNYGATHYSTPPVNVTPSNYTAATSYCINDDVLFELIYIAAYNGSLILNDKYTTCSNGCTDSLTEFGAACNPTPFNEFLLETSIIIVFILMVFALAKAGKRKRRKW